MRLTSHQPAGRTREDLERALNRRRAVTFTYIDELGRETVRTVELDLIRDTDAGDTIAVGLCRLRGDYRAFRLDRIHGYTVHRLPYILDHPQHDTTEDGTLDRDTDAAIAA